MKKIIAISFSLTLFFCKKSGDPDIEKKIGPIKNSDLAKGVLYEVNIRQFTREGTFNALGKELSEIKDLGVNILWLMPTYPISTTKSKGPLGSY